MNDLQMRLKQAAVAALPVAVSANVSPDITAAEDADAARELAQERRLDAIEAQQTAQAKALGEISQQVAQAVLGEAEKKRLAKVGVTNIVLASIPVPTILVGATRDLVLTFPKAMSTAFKWTWCPVGLTLGTAVPVEQARTTTTLTLRITATVAIAVGGHLVVVAYEEAGASST